MIRQFCDCCRAEFKEKEQLGRLQLPKTLYDGILKGETVVFHVEDKRNENPFHHLFNQSSDGELMEMDLCIECLRKLIALREHITLLHKQSHLGKM